MDVLNEIAARVEKGNNAEVPSLVREALDQGISPYEVLVSALQAGLLVVGARFKRNEAFIPEVLLSVRAMKAGMEILKPLLSRDDSKTLGKVLLGTVRDDLHDIGKNMVGMMLEGSGFEVIDLGINVPEETFLEKVMQEKPDILAMSALLSTTMPFLKTTIDVLEKNGVRDSVKVLVGGAPVTPEYAAEIGADGYAPDSASAVDKAKELLQPIGGAGGRAI